MQGTYAILNKATNTVLEFDNEIVRAGQWLNANNQRWLATAPRVEQPWQWTFQVTPGPDVGPMELTIGQLVGQPIPDNAQLIGINGQGRHFTTRAAGDGVQILTNAGDNPTDAEDPANPTAPTHAVAILPDGPNQTAVLQELDELDDNQIWYLMAPSLFPVTLQPGTYIIRNSLTGTFLHLDDAGSVRGRPRQVENNQTWQLAQGFEGLWSFQNNSAGQNRFLNRVPDGGPQTIFKYHAKRLAGQNAVAARFAITNVPGTNDSYHILSSTFVGQSTSFAVNIVTGAYILGINNNEVVNNITDNGAHVCLHHAAPQAWIFTRIA